LGPLLFICGAGGGFLSERVMWMEWDGEEVQVGYEVIWDKDTEWEVVGEEMFAARASDRAQIWR
jgi:hypothetical protein